jgi:hypothetical protein
MTGCIAARSVMAKARSREATIPKVVKVEAIVDVEDELEIRVSGSDQTVVESATVKVKIEEDRNGRASRRQQSSGVVSNSVVTVLRTKVAGVDKACSDTGRL